MQVGRCGGAVQPKFRRHKKRDLSSCHRYVRLNSQLLSAWTWTRSTPEPDAVHWHISGQFSNISERGDLTLPKDERLVKVR